MGWELGITAAVVATLILVASVATWSVLRARDLKRVRGYVLIPPPGKHSVSGRRRSPVPVAQHNDEEPRPASREAQTPPATSTASRPAPRRARVRLGRSQGSQASPDPGRHLVAPVELWFGTICVGVVRGSDTHRRFDEYASELLADLSAPSDRGHESAGRRARRRPVALQRSANSYARHSERR